MSQTEPEHVNFIDGPSPFASLAIWERHLTKLEQLPANTFGLQPMKEYAQKVIADKRKA